MYFWPSFLHSGLRSSWHLPQMHCRPCAINNIVSSLSSGTLLTGSPGRRSCHRLRRGGLRGWHSKRCGQPCLARWPGSQGFVRAHRFPGSAQHLAGSGLPAGSPPKPRRELEHHRCFTDTVVKENDRLGELQAAWREGNRRWKIILFFLNHCSLKEPWKRQNYKQKHSIARGRATDLVCFEAES